MTAADLPQPTVADVAVGDELPPLELDVTARTVVMGASASRDWQPQHHDHRWAMNKVGTDIFLNTPTQAGWIERYLTDWGGPASRLGHLTFRMRRTVTPRDLLRFAGTVEDVTVDASGTGWVELVITLTAVDDGDEEVATECTARLALPSAAVDNPWGQRGDGWRPDGPTSDQEGR